MASCVAVLSANNAPLFVLSDKNPDSPSPQKSNSESGPVDTAGVLGGNLADHYSLHQSLDVIEEKTSLSNAAKTGAQAGTAGAPGGQASRELYLGTLFTTEKKKVFGYVTNTKIKFVVIVDASNTSLRDNEIRQMFRKLHLSYTQLMCNPFYVPGNKITSKRYHQVAAALLASQSQAK